LLRQSFKAKAASLSIDDIVSGYRKGRY